MSSQELGLMRSGFKDTAVVVPLAFQRHCWHGELAPGAPVLKGDLTGFCREVKNDRKSCHMLGVWQG